MRRAAPPQMMRVDPTDPGPWAQMAQGPRGVGLVAAPAPAGADDDDHLVLRPSRGVPFATHDAAIVNNGALALTAAPGIARTLRLPDLGNLFDRRPPGLDRVIGAAEANAGLLRDAQGWRAVVLPSMGDLVPDLGAGPVAIRSDGRRIVVAHDDGVFEVELPGAATTQLHADTVPTALAYGVDGAPLIAVGGTVLGAAGDGGSPITSLVVASAAPVALARHEGGDMAVWDIATGEITARWAPPAGTIRIGISANGAHACVSTLVDDQPSAAIVRVSDGAIIRHIVGARVIVCDPQDRGILVGGDWGALWMEPPREAS